MPAEDTMDTFSWAPPTIKLDNGYLSVVIDLERPRIAGLRVDPSGRGRYSANLLATGLRPSSGRSHPDSGMLTQYVDAAGVLHSSSDGGRATATVDGSAALPTTGQLAAASPYAHLTRATISGIRCGAKSETWTVELLPDAAALRFTVDERWDASAEIVDCRTPVAWFSQRDDWGEPFHAQFLRRDLVGDDPYGNAAATLVSGGSAISRVVVPEAGAWIIAPTFARVDADLRLEGSAHLQRGAILNAWTFLGQTRMPPGTSAVAMSAGDSEQHRFELGFVPRGGGSVLELTGPVREVETARRLFATHANCAMVADPRLGLLGNEPDGYHVSMVTWVQARALQFATAGTPTAPSAAWIATELLRSELRCMAAATTAEGRVDSGYAAGTALDIAPSFALTLADWLTTTGDRDEGTRVLPAVRRALDRALADADAHGGLLSAEPEHRGEQSVQPDHVIDYWDWLRRRGAVTYPNVLLVDALRRHAQTEAWLGDANAVALRREQADALSARVLEELWDDDAGVLAESAESGRRSIHLYTAPQHLAILAGILKGEHARRALAALDTARSGPAADGRWRDAVAVPTNLVDASALMPRFAAPADEVVEFGHTMNGGSLLSWAYFEVGALVGAGRTADAWAALTRVLERFDATALLEGVNYWAADGGPSRARLEPFLSDVGIVAAAIPRWFLGIAPDLDGITIDPRLPHDGRWEVSFEHLGRPARIAVTLEHGDRRIEAEVAEGVAIRVLRDGIPSSAEEVTLRGEPAATGAGGTLPA